jgi:hypothetical protein
MPKAPFTALIVSWSLSVSVSAAGTDDRLATATLTASAQVSPRTAVQVSSDVLVFQVIDAEVPAEATVTFTAGARTRPDREVRLFMSQDLPASVTMTGSDGTLHAVMSNEPVMVSRWTGGGRKRGEIRFQLRGAPGTYTIPVRFSLNAP